MAGVPGGTGRWPVLSGGPPENLAQRASSRMAHAGALHRSCLRQKPGAGRTGQRASGPFHPSAGFACSFGQADCGDRAIARVVERDLRARFGGRMARKCCNRKRARRSHSTALAFHLESAVQSARL